MQDVKTSIKATYGATALQADKTVEGAKRVAQAFGYTKEDLEAIPQESNMGLSCGNPVAIASLKEGETVIDLGSGGGLDCFLAARKVGDSGKVIGIDMTPNMIELATNNAKKFGKDNVEFRLGEIESLPVENGTADCIISNCVINLSTDKQKVFNETFRVLKPGGRLAVSDICLKKALPSEILEAVQAYVGCIAGALHVDQYREMLEKAGFGDIDTVNSQADLTSYTLLSDSGDSCEYVCCSGACAPTKPAAGGCSAGAPACCGGGDSFSVLAELLKRYNINEYVGSYKIFAVKPV